MTTTISKRCARGRRRRLRLLGPRALKKGTCEKHALRIDARGPPIEVSSAFNGVAVYDVGVLRSGAVARCAYGSEPLVGTVNPAFCTHTCEHLAFHTCLRDAGVRLAILPSLVQSCNHNWQQRHLPSQNVVSVDGAGAVDRRDARGAAAGTAVAASSAAAARRACRRGAARRGAAPRRAGGGGRGGEPGEIARFLLAMMMSFLMGGNVSQFLTDPLPLDSRAASTASTSRRPAAGSPSSTRTRGPSRATAMFTPSTSNSVDLGYPLQTMRVSQNVERRRAGGDAGLVDLGF